MSKPQKGTVHLTLTTPSGHTWRDLGGDIDTLAPESSGMEGRQKNRSTLSMDDTYRSAASQDLRSEIHSSSLLAISRVLFRN
jgi:hypothetical protein